MYIAMKKIILSIALLSASLLMAQQKQSPVLFHNQLDYVCYQLEHPELIPMLQSPELRGFTSFSLKLDSVVGADNFDWTRWKNVYTYGSDEERPYDDRNRVEIHEVWENHAWRPEVKTECFVEGKEEKELFFRWNGEQWEDSLRVAYLYDEVGGSLRIQSVVSEVFQDTVWAAARRITYEYNEQSRLTLVMNYNQMNPQGEWMESSKVEYTYDEEGGLVKKLSWTIRDGNWRESEKDTLSYDEHHRCTTMLTQRKGGMGPWGGGAAWRDVSKVEFSYNAEGQLESEKLYSAGWFGSEMSLESKMEYQLDTKGNLVRKTASIYNGKDWVVRDVYENFFDTSVEAAKVLGLVPVWTATLGDGMGYVLDPQARVYSQWISCNITSMDFDTQFSLYYSGFASVDSYEYPSVKTYVSDGCLVVENDTPSKVIVYDLTGREVASESDALRSVFSLRPGIYMVTNGRQAVKTVVF